MFMVRGIRTQIEIERVRYIGRKKKILFARHTRIYNKWCSCVLYVHMWLSFCSLAVLVGAGDWQRYPFGLSPQHIIRDCFSLVDCRCYYNIMFGGHTMVSAHIMVPCKRCISVISVGIIIFIRYMYAHLFPVPFLGVIPGMFGRVNNWTIVRYVFPFFWHHFKCCY